MAVTIKPFIVGSKKATMMGFLSPVIAFAVFAACIKLLGLGFGESLKAAIAIAGPVAGYGVIEGLREIVGKGK